MMAALKQGAKPVRLQVPEDATGNPYSGQKAES